MTKHRRRATSAKVRRKARELEKRWELRGWGAIRCDEGRELIGMMLDCLSLLDGAPSGPRVEVPTVTHNRDSLEYVESLAMMGDPEACQILHDMEKKREV